ncbi:type VI protein secretion system component VasK [Arthrobacter ginsengisoli]|uniref:Type VI protein secretion system component VasK n=1 Tax=Arthrobacter ginsengisoli TaxID=1356565 RepID=A0ABU1UC35_9MICC|nr:PLDc N-terminal domain-containing protein [Arthrobacter ginsengisoli]MDR7082762.1 type VI protein secretion system component VasK [Arthrobacter ginsengisoli]
MSFWENFWDIFWWFICVYAFFAFLYALWIVIGDIFRDQQLNGWLKAVWIVFLAFVPFLSLLVYLIARGKGMTERAMERARQNQEAADAYIRQVATSSPTEEISKAKALLDAGTISADEFAKIKSSALV